MKLKGSQNAIHPDALLILFAIASLFLLPLRTYQLIKIVDPNRLFTDGANPL